MKIKAGTKVREIDPLRFKVLKKLGRLKAWQEVTEEEVQELGNVEIPPYGSITTAEIKSRLIAAGADVDPACKDKRKLYELLKMCI